MGDLLAVDRVSATSHRACLAAGYPVIRPATVATERCPRTVGVSVAEGATKRRLGGTPTTTQTLRQCQQH